MAEKNVPFHVPFVGEEEIKAVSDALRSLCLIGNGPITKRVEQQMKQMLDVKHALLTTSCTHAMELALMAADIGPGDEIILPSFTFSSTANAVVLQGARPVFAEIQEETLNIDPADIERKVNPHTRAIMPVHYNGIGCRMDEIMMLAKKHNLVVIEDAAQGVGAKYCGQHLGTIGDIGCYSFHGTKNVTCGEGGAFLTDDDDLFHRAEIMSEKGTNRSAFFRGEVDKYTWVDRGSSYILSDVLASLLEAQLCKLEQMMAARKEIYERYLSALQESVVRAKIVLPVIPPECTPNYHLFFFRTHTENQRNSLLRKLKRAGIGAAFHYIPLHSAPYGRRLGCIEDLPITERVSQTLVRLPIYPQLSSSDQEYVIETVLACLREM